MNQVQQILDKIKSMLCQMGFEETVISNPYRNEVNYVYGTLYCIPNYIESLGFLIEYADSYEEAKNHGHEDGESFRLDLGEEIILKGLEIEILTEMRKLT